MVSKKYSLKLELSLLLKGRFLFLVRTNTNSENSRMFVVGQFLIYFPNDTCHHHDAFTETQSFLLNFVHIIPIVQENKQLRSSTM